MSRGSPASSHSSTKTGFSSSASSFASGCMRSRSSSVMHPVPTPSCTIVRASSKSMARSSRLIRNGELRTIVPEVRKCLRCSISNATSERKELGEPGTEEQVGDDERHLPDDDTCEHPAEGHMHQSGCITDEVGG